VLLKRGLKVRGATRSAEKGKAMLEARPEFASKLDFVQIQDFEKTGVFDEAVKDVDAVIHVASVCFSPKIKETPSIESLLLIIFAALYL
jgi:nucleoside-diphosphate-sugar epimerase